MKEQAVTVGFVADNMDFFNAGNIEVLRVNALFLHTPKRQSHPQHQLPIYEVWH